MNTVLLIFILALILIILMALNSMTHIKIYHNYETDKVTDDVKQGTCIDTHYGCCPDGVNSKINFFGTNCPGFVPPPPPLPTPKNPIGGCLGTRFGCCPNGITPKINEEGLNCTFNR
jgi:hypothetical protein